MLHHAATLTQTTMEERDVRFLSWKYSHYFEFVSAKDENIKVRCTLCAGDKVLSSFKSTTSNLKKHLESQHSSGYRASRESEQKAASKATALTSAGGPPPPKQQKLDLQNK